MKFILDRIPRQTNQGMFLGNGTVGCVMYLKGSKLHFSMDHNELWETRDSRSPFPPKKFEEIVEHQAEFTGGNREFSRGTKEEGCICPTKLPGVGFEIDLHEQAESFYSELDTQTASLTFSVRTRTHCWSGSAYLHSVWNVFVLDVQKQGADLDFCGWDLNNPQLHSLKAWEYLPAGKCVVEGEQRTESFVQPFSGNKAAVFTALKAENGKFYVTLKVTEDGQQHKAAAENVALLTEFEKQEDDRWQEHLREWESFWNASSISVPEPSIQDAYEMELYKMHCNMRAGTLPVTLQGIWNCDERMPPWNGDWHNDLNIQACYWPCYRTNHAQDAEAYVDYYSACEKHFEERAQKYFGIDGAVHVPVTMAPGGHGSGTEWSFWNMLLGGELMVAVDFCTYYDYTQDKERLRNKIYPFLKKVIKLYRHISREGADGYRHIPMTQSPELFLNGHLVLREDSTFVISTLHYLLERMQTYAGLLDERAEQAVWSKYNRELCPVPYGENGFPVFPQLDLPHSHRHFCQLYPIFPLQTDVHNEAAEKSLNHVVNQGFTGYAAFSFPYLAMFAARCGRGNMAATMLRLYMDCFRSRNTFTMNGDCNHTGLLEISDQNAGEDATAFTLEAGFMFASALCDMFVHRAGSTIYIAAGLPDSWKQAECRKLKVEGGHTVDITIENYQVTAVTVTAAKDETVSFKLFAPNKTYGDVSLKKGETKRIL